MSMQIVSWHSGLLAVGPSDVCLQVAVPRGHENFTLAPAGACTLHPSIFPDTLLGQISHHLSCRRVSWFHGSCGKASACATDLATDCDTHDRCCSTAVYAGVAE